MNSLEHRKLAELGIANLAEVIRAVIEVMRDIDDAKSDDGKISSIELLFIGARCFPEMFSAAMDISNVPEELKQLDASKVVALADVLFDPEAMKDEWRIQQTDRIIGALVQLVHVWQGFRDRENWTHPPKAKVIP